MRSNKNAICLFILNQEDCDSTYQNTRMSDNKSLTIDIVKNKWILHIVSIVNIF